jgi:hypothetical protein
MTRTLQARIEGRRLFLFEDGEPRLELPLDEGGRHRLVVPDAATASQALQQLEGCTGVGVLPDSGGLLGALTVAENFSLALRYDAEPDDPRDWEAELAEALHLCGVPAARLATLGRERPMNLERTLRWTLGLARCLLRPPDLLLIDRLFAGLTRRQALGLIAVEAVYHQRHPFRPVLFLDLDSHELPALPDCRSLTELADAAEAACHC